MSNIAYCIVLTCCMQVAGHGGLSVKLVSFTI